MDEDATELLHLKKKLLRLQARYADLEKRLRDCENSVQSKTRFLEDLSLELRTPINGVLGMLQLARATPSLEERQEYLEMAQVSASTLQSLVNDLLEFSALDSGRLPLVEKLFDLRAEFSPLLRNFKSQSQWKSLEFSYQIDDALPLRLIGDADRTKQILVNLLNNAFAYTKKGFISVTVGPWRGQNGGREAPTAAPRPGRCLLHVTVKDSGIGIAGNRQADLFKPFAVGAHPLEKQYSGGAGLGLAVCKRLVRMMRGDIWLESREGHGSTFHFTVECGLADQFVASLPPKTAAVPDVQPRNLKILLAEDEPVNRIFTVRVLQKCGFTVLTAVDGKEALQLLSREPVDLVLMDIQMPRLNGLDATRAIRAGQVPGVNPAIPIVALTAFAMESDKVRGLEAGMNEYLTKPFEAPMLMEAIQRVMH
ncbi:response regulator [Desulfolutivibrio sp.]|uniref:response regulator n=1 Tax=Desulfolutivibrio sp. TaxID=2773296 RepID=UPI002F96511F